MDLETWNKLEPGTIIEDTHNLINGSMQFELINKRFDGPNTSWYVKPLNKAAFETYSYELNKLEPNENISLCMYNSYEILYKTEPVRIQSRLNLIDAD
jgi:hypothetical protein